MGGRSGNLYDSDYSGPGGSVDFDNPIPGMDHHVTYFPDEGYHKSYDSDAEGNPSRHHMTDHTTGQPSNLPNEDAPRPG